MDKNLSCHDPTSIKTEQMILDISALQELKRWEDDYKTYFLNKMNGDDAARSHNLKDVDEFMKTIEFSLINHFKKLRN